MSTWSSSELSSPMFWTSITSWWGKQMMVCPALLIKPVLTQTWSLHVALLIWIRPSESSIVFTSWSWVVRSNCSWPSWSERLIVSITSFFTEMTAINFSPSICACCQVKIANGNNERSNSKKITTISPTLKVPIIFFISLPPYKHCRYHSDRASKKERN